MDFLRSPVTPTKKLKHILSTAVCLTLALLLLAGCATAGTGPAADASPSEENTTPEDPTGPSADTPPESTADPEPSQPAFPMGSTGNATDGALCSLPLDMGTYCNAHLWGDTILLYNASGSQLRSLQDGSLLASGTGIPDSATVTEDFIIYYAPNTHKIVFRDRSLKSVKTVDADVSDEVTEMLFTQDGSKAFYHIYPANAIVELDIQTGEEREIPVDGAPIWSLSGFAFNTLYYWGREANQDYYAFVELSSGEYLGKDTQITKLQTWDNGYYLCRAGNSSTKHQIVIESTEQYIDVYTHEDLLHNAWALPQLNSLFALHSNFESSTAILELYDFSTGDCTASLTVDLGAPYHAADVFADPSGEYIWLCLKIGNTSDYQTVLYRWDYKANAVE